MDNFINAVDQLIIRGIFLFDLIIGQFSDFIPNTN